VKKLLNTLYVTTEGASLRKDGENLVAEIEGAERARVPFHMLASVVVIGATYISPALIGALARGCVTLVLLDRQARFEARVEGPVSGNVLLRRAQYRAAEQPDDIVRGVVSAKVANQRAVLMRALRDYAEELVPERRLAIETAVERLGRILQRVAFANEGADVMRGAEGEAANVYFAVFGNLIRSPDADICFRGRSRHPPLDPVNALLSFLYTLLTHDCRSAAEGVGLDPAVGFLHRERPGRPSLALDLMEELRPVLSDAGRKTVLTAWQERKKEERKHPFLDETAPLGLVPHLQAQLLARHLRGDLDAYPPWFWK
jgi:CRISPR-associated protein Cas1